MPNLTPDGLRIVAEIASRHGVSLEAAFAVLDSLALSNGAQAQFSHPDLGGMGQWSRGGMIMIGDMFNHGLKHRVDGLCNELASLVRDRTAIHAEVGRAQSQSERAVSLFVEGSGSASRWWPLELGDPASVGAQNDMRYAFFPGSRRIAIQEGGRLRVYDSGEHRLSGFSQQQGGDQSLTFSSQFGVVSLAELAEVPVGGETSREPPPPAPPPPIPVPQARTAVPATPVPGTPVASLAASEILAIIEGLAGLREKNVITEDEFRAKKSELLSRL